MNRHCSENVRAVLSAGFLIASAIRLRLGAPDPLLRHQPSADDGSPRLNPMVLVLVVGRIATPEALQDGRIRYRSGSNEVGVLRVSPLDGASGM